MHHGLKYLHLQDFQQQQESPLLDFLLDFHPKMLLIHLPGFLLEFHLMMGLSPPPRFRSGISSQEVSKPPPRLASPFSSGFPSQDGPNSPSRFPSAFSSGFASQGLSNQVYGSKYSGLFTVSVFFWLLLLKQVCFIILFCGAWQKLVSRIMFWASTVIIIKLRFADTQVMLNLMILLYWLWAKGDCPELGIQGWRLIIPLLSQHSCKHQIMTLCFSYLCNRMCHLIRT